MKKALALILTLFVLLFLGIYTLLFSSFGNALLADYAAKKAKELTGLDINISKFELSFSDLSVQIFISRLAVLDINGSLSPFKLGFDLDYALNLNKEAASGLNLNLKDNIDFKGQIRGVVSDFNANGTGELLGSKTQFDARIVDYAPLELKLNASNLKIEELLALLSKPDYARGFVSVNADILAKDLKPDGTALINIDTTGLNYALIEKDFNLTLPAHAEPKGKIAAVIKNDNVLAKSEIYNDFLKISTQNTLFNLSSKALNSDFSAQMPDLSKLDKLLKAQSKGSLQVDGNVSLDNFILNSLNAKAKGTKFSAFNLPQSNLNLDLASKLDKETINFVSTLNSSLLQIPKLNGSYKLNSKALSLDTQILAPDLNAFKELAGTTLQGSAKMDFKAELENSSIKSLDANANIASGTIKANSNGQKLNVDIKNLDLAKALVLVAQPAYASGILNASLSLNSLDFSRLNGSYEAFSSGTLGQKALSKLLAKNFPANAKFNASIKGDIKDSVLYFDSVLKSDLANLNAFKGSFDINKAVLSSNFSLDAYDFSKLSFLAGRKLSGKALINGSLGFDKSLNLSAKSENLYQGKLDLKLANNALKADIAGVDFSALMRGFDLPDYYEGKAAVAVDYNLLSEVGTATAKLSNARLKNTKLVQALSALVRKNLSEDSFNKADIRADLSKNDIKLNISTTATHIDFSIQNGHVNKNTYALNLPFRLVIDRADFTGSIKGTSQNPSVSLDAGSVVKSAAEGLLRDEKVKGKVDKEINKLLNKIF